MLSNLENQLLVVVLGLQSVENRGKSLAIELDVDDGTNYLMDVAITGSRGRRETSRQGRGEALGDGRETLSRGRAAEVGRGAERPLEAAVFSSRQRLFHPQLDPERPWLTS
jgi:hypothetical protein